MEDLVNALCVTILFILSLIGLVTVCYFLKKWAWTAWDTLRKLNETLTEAVGFLREHRQDLTAVRQFQAAMNAAEVQILDSGATAGQNVQQGYQKPPQPVLYPDPSYRYMTAEQIAARLHEIRQEPDAPDGEAVEVSPTEADLVDEDRAEQMERMGLGRPDPEFKPKAVEVDSEG